MAKNFKLIPDENSNWEVAIFLLIDHINPGCSTGHYFSISTLHSSTSSMTFIEKLLGPINYEVSKTLTNSISSAITRIKKAGYITCSDSQCALTKSGYNRLVEIRTKFNKASRVPVGKTKKVADIIDTLLNSLPNKDTELLIAKLSGISHKPGQMSADAP